MSAVANPRGSVSDRVEDLLEGGPDRRRGRLAPTGAAGAGPSGEGQQVISLGLVELQRRGQTVQDARGGAGQVASFHPDVVVDGYPGEQRHFLTSQAGHAPISSVCRQSGLVGRDAGALGPQEVADLRTQV